MDSENNLFQPHHIKEGSSVEGIPVAPSMDVTLQQARFPYQSVVVNFRVVYICLLAVLLGTLAAFISEFLIVLISVITNIVFYGRFSTDGVSPAGHQLGVWVVLIPALGGIIVGLMARYGSQSIRGAWNSGSDGEYPHP
jgi:CIC family chloride channel protein